MPKNFFKKYSPTPEKIKENKALGFLGDRLHRPNLWHLNRHSVAKAFAIGLFCTWLPFPFQTVVAAVLAIYFCANLPLSIVLVFVTNPITIPPMFYFAYRLGNTLLMREPGNFDVELSWEWFSTGLAEVWEPLLFGSLILGVVSSVLGYVAIQLIWRHSIVCRWRERAQLRKLRKQVRLRKEQKNHNNHEKSA